MASTERLLLVAGFAAVAGAAASYGVHQYYESNVAPLIEGAIRDADKESPPVPPAELAMALEIRNNYLNGLRAKPPLNVGETIDPTFPFDPERIRDESSRPEVLQAKITLDEQSKNVNALARIRRERSLDVIEKVGVAAQAANLFITGMGSIYSVMLGYMAVGARRYRNRPTPA